MANNETKVGVDVSELKEAVAELDTTVTKIDWKRKLTSRKFWVAVVGFVTAVMTAFKFTENDIAQVTSIIMAGGTLIAYILSEGMADAAAAGKADTFNTYYNAPHVFDAEDNED